ncbi:MAG: putative ATPase superfamily [Eubacterium sp.]|jgi:predicted AAA+ superfamily ATPase|nr:putative ATPase superfamily [Eubacterium sp.]
MVYKRKIYSKLLKWKEESNGARALLVEGARRIGKSTIVEEFAKNEYRSYLLIDFAKATDQVLDYFKNNKGNLNELFMLLSVEYGVKLYNRESIIIFDEVQRFPTARELIKYLVADGRYDYIETGSLISIKENVQNIVIPSEERKLKMYPMDFEEFCLAFGEEILSDYIKQCFDNRQALSDGLHRKAMLLFKQYMLIGGMPQAVDAYLQGNYDFEAADAAKRDIIELYRDDILKITDRYRSKVLSIFDQIPGFLSKHEKRVILSNIVDGSTIDQYSDTFFWLGNSMICNECFLTKDPNVGLSLNEERSYIKCYMGDTGLLISHAFDENELVDDQLYQQIMRDKLSINQGMLFENTIAQMLVANGHKLYFYTHYSEEKHRNDIEIDFIISNNSKLKYKIYPIEVKSSKRYTTTSLVRFREKYNNRIGESYIIHPKEFKIEDGIICIPPYMTMCI